jgi:hypothetical protein
MLSDAFHSHLAGERKEQIRRSADLEVARAFMNDAMSCSICDYDRGSTVTL